MPRLWYWQIQTKAPAILSCSKLNLFLHKHKHTIEHSRVNKSKDPQGTWERWSILGLRVLDLLRTLPHTSGNCTMGSSILQSLAWVESWCPHHFLHFQIFWTPEACEATGDGVVSWPNCCWLVWEHLVRIISNTNKSLFNHFLFCLSDSLFLSLLLSHFFSFSPVREVWYRD